MATTDGSTPPHPSSQDRADRQPAPAPPITQKPTTLKTELSRIADYLADDYEIGLFRDRPPKHRRYAVLRTQALFNKLVAVYTRLFKQNYEFLKRAIDGFTIALGVRDRHWDLAAQAYVSCWFFDLYVSIRNATEKVSGTAFVQHYHTPAAHISHEYDAFLTHLNAIIRPTHIKLAMEDVIYIPLVAQTMVITDDNPFGLEPTSWKLDADFAYSILDRMKATGSRWRVEPLVTDTLGRPGWLFDWHTVGNDHRAYAWFPEEGNYSEEDLIAPHIIGEAMTPNIGPRDVDDWQYFAGFTRPAEVQWHRFNRIVPRRFRGSAEVRTYEEEKHIVSRLSQSGQRKRSRAHGSLTIPGTSVTAQATGEEPQEIVTDVPISETTTPSQAQTLFEQNEVDRFRIIDWTYYSYVVAKTTQQKSDGAIRLFCFK